MSNTPDPAVPSRPCACGCGRPVATVRQSTSPTPGSARNLGGRPQRYHLPQCRQRAYRARRRVTSGTSPNHPIDPVPDASPGRGICGPRVILSLCDWSGEWSRPYIERGYQVIQVDLRHGVSVRMMAFPGQVHGIIAAPPCTVFSRAGNWRPRDRCEIEHGLSVVDACLRFVTVCRPAWWALENPPGKLHRWLGPPAHSFEPWWYGDSHTKQTHLWGSFTPPARSVFERPNALRSLCDSVATAKQRAITPSGFAAAFADANP